MSPEDRSLILTFRTSHDALWAERQALNRGLAAELIPVPRGIASDCGFCLLIAEAEGRAAIEAVVQAEPEGMRAVGVWLVAERGGGERAIKEKRYERIA